MTANDNENIRVVRVSGAQPATAKMLGALQAECFEPEDRAPTSEGFWWVALDRVTPVAFACLTEDVERDTAFLHRGGVLPAARGKGIQKLLIEARLEFARALGLKYAETHTVHHNHASSNSLIACGFKLFGGPTDREGNPKRATSYLIWGRDL